MSETPDMDERTLSLSPDAAGKTLSAFLTQKGIDAGAVDLDTGATPEPTSTPPRTDLDVRSTGEERYRIGAELARGGMGAVLSAKDLNLRRDVAMKIVLDPQAAKDSQILRFVHEAQVTGQLEHPSIIPVYELGVDAEDHVYYTMKYIRGTNLGDVLKGIKEGDPEIRRDLPLSRLLNIFIKACDALAFAHSRGVIHRDLKPDNIMVGDFGEVLIVDWGLAKVLATSECGIRNAECGTPDVGDEARVFVESVRDGDSGSAVHTLDGAVMGTPAYMAPEQADGDVERMGPPADIYAMGAILYTILTLEAPFTGDSVNEILNKVLDGDLVAPDRHDGEHPHCPEGTVPAPLSSVVMKAMAADLEERYVSVQSLQTEVQAYLDGFATRAEEAGPWRLARLFLARHRGLVIALAVTLIALTAAAGTAIHINVAARQRAELALQALEEEQAQGLELRRAAGPALVRAARAMVEQHDLDGAAAQLTLAREYDPGLPAAHMLTAQLRIVDSDYTAALESLNTVLALTPDDAAAKELLHLSRQAEHRSPFELRAAASSVFSAHEAWTLADRLEREQGRAVENYGKALKEVWPRLEVFKRLYDGGLLLVGLPREVSDLSPLRGVPIDRLYIPDLVGLSDLGPLRNMPLSRLRIPGSQVEDLSPLVGMSLRILELGKTQVGDLSPLAGMPLHSLWIGQTKVSDLSPLKGMPLRRLDANYLRHLTNITALAGMPLVRLYLEHTTALRDLSPLAACTSLEDLNLNANPAQDLSPLRGLPLKKLSLTGQHTLAPLAGMPLEDLRMVSCPIRDISALRGMPLRRLTIAYSTGPLTDLSPLRGMPLEYLNLDACKAVEDFSVIRTLTSLEELTLPEQSETIDFLDDLPHLQRVIIRKRFSGTPEEFREYQARRLQKAPTEKTP